MIGFRLLSNAKPVGFEIALGCRPRNQGQEIITSLLLCEEPISIFFGAANALLF